MKRVALVMVSLALVMFSVPAINAQNEIEDAGTKSTLTDSTTQQGSTLKTEEAKTGTTSDTKSIGTDKFIMESRPEGSSMKTAGSEIITPALTSSGGGVKDLSGLEEKATPEVINQFKPIAEERTSELTSKLGLDAKKADKISKSIMSYFDNYWESRVALDKENNAEDIKDHNMDLADQRVDLIDDIEGELTEDQINQFKSFKVDWWKSLDLALFDVQQNAATSSLARDNENKTDEQQ